MAQKSSKIKEKDIWKFQLQTSQGKDHTDLKI